MSRLIYNSDPKFSDGYLRSLSKSELATIKQHANDTLEQRGELVWARSLISYIDHLLANQ